ncbi:hypothetical protein [Schlesneria paludicola]|uniref:hypothetical protein n=1 Tax=Schlesneria paludicola TaxID=360056 RepID=UPI000299EAE5|nr:hypothetical protein [Schlesneria paludicola]
MPGSHPFRKSVLSASTEEVIVSEHLADLRGRVRLLTWISGLCSLAVVVFGGLLITGMLDWFVHFDESGTRLVFALGLLGAAGWILWKQLIGPLRVSLTGTFLAARVEKRFPDLKNRVVSAVEFLEHRLDSRLGSSELQQVVVKQALKDLERIEPADVIESGAIRNLTFAGLVVTAITAITVILHPAEAVTSVQRLAFPFAPIPWPRAVELQLVHADLSSATFDPDHPFLIARGDTLELYVKNRKGKLPERVWFEYRVGDEGPVARETLRQTTVRDEQGRSHETAVLSWIATRGEMQFRVSGGDDETMPFYRIEVVQPPNLESLQVTVTPPAYSLQTKETLPPGVGHVQGLIGTKVEVTATSDKPLKSAVLHVGTQAAVDVPLDPGRHELAATFEIKEAAANYYWFELTDERGFTDHEPVRYELRGIGDGVPVVTIELPVTDVTLTADAELPIQILAKDDLGLRDVQIRYQIGDDEATKTIPLYTYQRQAAAEAAGDSPAASGVGEPSGLGPQQQQVEHVWKMSDLSLQPGTQIVFRGEATDDCDIGPPHIGSSIPRTITIVSRDEKQKELASRVGDLHDDLKQATEMQQRARQQTRELQTQLENVGEFRSQDLDQLQRTELDQRQTASRLTNAADGVETRARKLLDEFRGNRVNDEATEARLARLANELERLEKEELPAVERALTAAQKTAESQRKPDGSLERPQESISETENSATKSAAEKSTRPATAGDKKPARASDPAGAESQTAESATPSVPSDSKEAGGEKGEPQKNEHQTQDGQKQEAQSGVAKAKPAPRGDQKQDLSEQTTAELNEAQENQTRALETLQELQEALSEWRDRRDVSRDLDSVIAEQEAVQKEAAEMAQNTLTKSAAELTKQEKAELNKLAARQLKVSEQLDQFRKQLQQTAESLRKSDEDAAERMSEVGQQLNEQETASKLQEAAQDIADNKLGSATQAQQSAMDELRDVERMMKRQPQEDLEQFVKQTEEAQQEFQQIRQEQQDLADRAQDLAKQPESMEKTEQVKQLMEQQEELTERMAKAERKLERLRLHGPADAAHQARKRLTEMMKNAQEAEDGEEMSQAMDEALEDLEQVERELVLEKRIAQERLAFEQLEKIEDELKSLRSRQETVLAETVRLDEARGERDSFSRGQLKTLKDLAETERSLHVAAEQMQQQMASAEVFSLVLKRLARTLKLAADRLGEQETGGPTQTLENEGLRKIDSLLAVLKQEKKKPEKPAEGAEKPEDLSQEPKPESDKPEEAQPPGDTIPQLAQLKLLKSLQEEYLERTELLNKLRDKDGKLPESVLAEKEELAREQAELADFARALIVKYLQQQPDREEGDESPEAKPDPVKDQDQSKKTSNKNE